MGKNESLCEDDLQARRKEVCIESNEPPVNGGCCLDAGEGLLEQSEGDLKEINNLSGEEGIVEQRGGKQESGNLTWWQASL